LRVLIIGIGGREHALATAFAKSPKVSRVYVAPGNAGIAREYPVLPLRSNADILAYCLRDKPELVFIGPEAPLAEGLADILREAGIRCVGPSQAAARIETSKVFARELMRKYLIPGAGFHVVSSLSRAEEILSQSRFPLVIKADGLAAGKGVIIAHDLDAARDSVQSLLSTSAAKENGILIEEFLQGWEVSLFAFTDSINYVTTIFSQDHKQLLDGDLGPNTGGMGAYAPVLEAEAWKEEIERSIIGPTLKALREEGCPFSGVLYCGLMITLDGPRVVEFNCRFGDPETQAILPLLGTDMVDVCDAILAGKVNTLDLKWREGSSVAVVLAASGYPGAYRKGDVIEIPSGLAGDIYYSGVAVENDSLVTNGGRVLCVSSCAADLASAREQAYRDAELIHFAGKIYRRDISRRKNVL